MHNINCLFQTIEVFLKMMMQIYTGDGWRDAFS
ncbi:Uncharacterised protein [Citrobacter koseri]|uniref:Uncharacterized protein n=1 Tax=Citrobacter koseri TaxID=545 RepID=A0A3S5DP88_CITKO|nr:Uncharacterised protein [Citrobacter koseri]